MSLGEPGPIAAETPRALSGGSGYTRDIEFVLLLLADGFRPDVLQALCAAGELPNMTRYFLSEGSYHDGITVLPSVTNVAYLPMLTGQYPGTANLPGIRWVDKSRFTFKDLLVKGHRSYIGPAHLRFNDDLPDDLETLFELSPGSLAIRSDIHRGLSPGLNRFYRASVPFMFFSHYFKRADFVDKIALRTLIRALRKMDGNLPRFVFLPMLDVDTASHAHGPEARQTLDAYRRVDAAVGAIVDRLKRMGIWQKTHILISSDHGHTRTTQHLDLSGMVSHLGYNVFEHPNIYRRVANAAVAISGNSFANVYVASEGRWERPSVGDELEGEHCKLLEALSQREEVEWIAYRHDNGAIKIASRAGAALLNRIDDNYTYDFEGPDPLQLGLSGSKIHESEALKVTANTRFPDALEQIWQLFTSRRTGDIVVTAKPRYDLRGWREWPEHRSSHGALCSEHMKVPILSSRPFPSNGPVRTVDLFPTIIESLGLTPTKTHSGRSLW